MEFEQFIKPELYTVAPALYIMGHVLKGMKTVRDNFIPLILCVTGIIIALIYILATSDNYDFRSIMQIAFTSITQGFLCAGAAVLTDQLRKQYQKNRAAGKNDSE